MDDIDEDERDNYKEPWTLTFLWMRDCRTRTGMERESSCKQNVKKMNTMKPQQTDF